MIQKILQREEGKTLEFKESASSLLGIAKTVVAFANTAGGIIIVGVQDKTKKIVGLTNPLDDETRIINNLSESIVPFFIPNIEIQTYNKKTLILIQVPYAPGPYSLKKEGASIVYVRFGSTNRIADAHMIATMKSLSKNITFDEAPCVTASKNDLDWENIEHSFTAVGKHITEAKAKSMGLLCAHAGTDRPSNGGIILFGKKRGAIFPDAIIRCVRFLGTTREKSLDHLELNKHLPDAVDEVLYFINKNTFTKTEIGRKRRISVPQFPEVAVREAVINALVHTDYSIRGSSIIIAIFDDRIEITNPGGMPFGLSLEDALAGSSRVRNRVIAKTFHLLELIEQWGSGFQKIIQSCLDAGREMPKFEELGSQFRVTLYAAKEHGKHVKVGTSKNDPQGRYVILSPQSR